MNKTAYIPRANSLATRVIAFLASNPGRELSLEDITDRWDDITRGNIHTQLGLAVDAGMLVRKQNHDGDWLYLAGPDLIRPPVSGLDMDAVHRAKPPAAKATLVHIAIETVVIEDDVPLPTNKGRAKQDWPALLKRMQPKQSCKLPLAAKHTLSQAITAAHKEQLGSFTMRTFPDTKELRLWRTA